MHPWIYRGFHHVALSVSCQRNVKTKQREGVGDDYSNRKQIDRVLLFSKGEEYYS